MKWFIAFIVSTLILTAGVYFYQNSTRPTEFTLTVVDGDNKTSIWTAKEVDTDKNSAVIYCPDGSKYVAKLNLDKNGIVLKRQ
jgi:hypothetical protein